MFFSSSSSLFSFVLSNQLYSYMCTFFETTIQNMVDTIPNRAHSLSHRSDKRMASETFGRLGAEIEQSIE